MMVILKAEGIETLTMFLDDFITRYKEAGTII